MNKDMSVTELTQELIRSRSYSGEENGVVQILTDFFSMNGLTDIRTDDYGNLIVSVSGSGKGDCLLFDGHIDTVPVPDPSVWKHDPFGGEIEEGRLYGRGTSDMKGAVAAMSAAMVEFVRAHGTEFNGSLHFAGIVHEECFEGVAARAVSEALKPDIVVIGEASEMNLKIGQRGRAEIKLETYGKSVHSSNPEKGVNAVYSMMRLIERLRTIRPPENPRLKKGYMELTDITSVPYPGASVLPSLCVATYDRRLLPGETRESVLQPVLDVIREMEEEDPSFRAKAYYAFGEERCYTGTVISGERFFPGWLYDPEEDYIVRSKKRLDEIGIRPELTAYDFCTNGSHYAGEAGIRAIGFGPSRENLAHTVDEYVEVSQLEDARDGYVGLMEALLLKEQE